MPKPRTVATEQRRLARSMATADALNAIAALAAQPPALVPPAGHAAYREQIARIAQWFSRAHRLSALLGDTARDAGSEPGESGA